MEFVVRYLSNNARKRKHMVKMSRHRKVVLPVKVSNEVLHRAFGSVDYLNKMINYINEDIRSQLSMYKRLGIEEVIR